MILIKNIKVYSPKCIGIKDVLVTNGKITLIEDEIEVFNKNIRIIDGTDKKLVPGLVDNHVHITGGGGEGSFKTRVPEIVLSKLIEGGITTVVGLLGTDGTTRSVENLVAKAKSLKEEGLSVYVHTGSYGYPPITLTGSVKRDIMFVDEIIGVKISLSDHRSPNVSYDELSRLASDARVAGMLSGKAGIVVVHMGDGKEGLNLINKILGETNIPITTMIPTHVNRKDELLDEAFDYAKKGGIIDLTCGISKDMTPVKSIIKAELENVPLKNILISSDGYGSWSNYDEKGNMIEIGVSSVGSLYNEFKSMVLDYDFDIEKALQFYTINPSKSLKLYPKKGIIQEGSDADLIIINKNIEINTVIANGKIMFNDGEAIVKGTYE